MDDVPPTIATSGPDADGIDWSLCTWKGSRRQQHLEYWALPLRRKLEVLEELCDLSLRLLENCRREGRPYRDPYTREIVRPPAPTPAAGGEG